MIRASSILFWFGLTIAASLGLYHTSYRVHELEQQLHQLNGSIDAEQESLHVLKAEWVYLANPARIGTEARKHLVTMRPTSPQQIARFESLSEILPTREEAMASVTVSGTPIANVKTSLAMPTQLTLSTKNKIADADTSYINTHVNIQHTENAQPASDQIGALIERYGAHP